MSTSGTVATTIIDSAAMIEHAFRRAKVPPAQQTPETVQIARENLYFILLNLSNRGLNLWAVEKKLLSLQPYKATYETAAGTLDVLNVVLSTPTLTSSVLSQTVVTPPVGPDEYTGASATFSSAHIVRVGFSMLADFTGQVGVQTSTAVIEVLSANNTYIAGVYYWVDVPTQHAVTEIQIVASGVPSTAPLIEDIVVATAIYDIPLTIWSRDTYAALPNKNATGRPTCYFYEKKLTPTLTLWPQPTYPYIHLTLFQQRQPQDVGTLIQQVEVPQRWYDGIIWLLAAKIGFELPSVDPAHLTLLVQMADKMEFEAEQSETDGAPIYITPGISVYTK